MVENYSIAGRSGEPYFLVFAQASIFMVERRDFENTEKDSRAFGAALFHRTGKPTPARAANDLSAMIEVELPTNARTQARPSCSVIVPIALMSRFGNGENQNSVRGPGNRIPFWISRPNR